MFFEGVETSVTWSSTASSSDAREKTGRSRSGTSSTAVSMTRTSPYQVGALHATGAVELFNQFSLSWPDLYAIEGLQIAAETDNPLEAAVQSYVFGEVTESADTGDILSASANQDTILIGTDGKTDEYRIEAPTEGAEAWIYGMGDGTSLDASEDVIIGLNGSTVSSMSDVSQGHWPAATPYRRSASRLIRAATTPSWTCSSQTAATST